MRIVIDMQGAQTESRFRGIGRYTLSLAKAIVRNRGEHEIILALSGLFPDTIEPIRSEFNELLPQENIRVWYAPGPVRECDHGNAWRREAAELIREAFIASLQPDIIHISSLFEGYVDDAVSSIGAFNEGVPVSVSLFDLIPLINFEQYLKPNPAYEKYYHRKVAYLQKSSLLLAISNYARQEGVDNLTQNTASIINISTAVDNSFHPLNITQAQEQKLQDKFGLTRSFLLYTGGADERKNLPRLVRAYAQLSPELRDDHQLVFAGRMPEGNVHQLQQIAKSEGLHSGELIFTGYITDDELVKLYNLCKLYVFPSWHEGFGLPALEAMSCGAAVIGANTSSLPEVIGNEDALFDPFSEEAIALKMTQVLSNEDFRQGLIKSGLNQAKQFSWDRSATKAIAAFENLPSRKLKDQIGSNRQHRPRLAFVSPLPPQKTGIADYSAELIPALSSYYEIDVIVAQDKVSNEWIEKNCPIRSVEWFLNNADQYDRVLYHFGNSPFHQHMYSLLKRIPGTVCLHDFYMSGYSRYMELTSQELYHWTKDLYYVHGYHAVRDRFHAPDDEAVMYQYPCNLKVLQSENGIIVHSKYSKQLAADWYDKRMSNKWRVIPLLRQPNNLPKINNPREICNIPENAFVVCSFGLLDSTKLNHRLLSTWLASSLSKDPNCYLVFVGESCGGEYGRELHKMIQESGVENRIRITGWASVKVFQAHLAVADIAVQLRTKSRGETSAAILDCMSYGLPTIANANGSMAELPADAVWLLADEFKDGDLVQVLETLWKTPKKRQALSSKAKETIERHHSPEACARQYAEVIECSYQEALADRQHLITALGKNNHLLEDEECLKNMASCIAQNLPGKRPARTFFIDVTATCRNDLKTGIERVARALLLQFINEPPEGFRVEPVYLTNQGGFWHYRYARHYTLELLECPNEWINDDIIESQPGDMLFAADLSGEMVVGAEKAGVYKRLRNIGVNITFTVFDLLPASCSEMFPPDADIAFRSWLGSVCRISDRVICISKAVADELIDWHSENTSACSRLLEIDWFHLGADIKKSVPSSGMPDEAERQLVMLEAKPSFLMVGTIEPRKGHLQAIEAFDKLWQQGVDVNLAIVGKEGWQGLPDNQRRTIPKIIDVLRSHPEFGKRLFWLEGISDEYLEKVYAASTCLIAASEGEGFGLPLIEAAQHKLSIIARDIPVFKEVAGEYAYYFDGKKTTELATAIRDWLKLYKANEYPRSEEMPWLTWKESAIQLGKLINPSAL